ncbi:hypothetical protein HPB52_014689 [Rhipicephalus sanguineus]|uniref:Uncharacterized protein n=1 Tax=Rhipicephalus sanguineus TaxID=34632 RepID=A0A9D4TAL1_RHISA|nr:hypothetical protein HPB52_014689 [Rhipicephalus sanguineus]
MPVLAVLATQWMTAGKGLGTGPTKTWKMRCTWKMHANDAVATNEDLTDEAIVAAVTGAEDDSSDDEEEPEPMQVVLHQEALQMIYSLCDFVC